MRRLVVSVGVVFGLILIGAGPAFAEPAPEASAAQEAVPGKKVCKVTDQRLDELSGIVATDDGFIVINDSTQQDSRKRVFFLNAKCKVVDTVAFSGNGPRDTEDMVLSADGKTLWIADIGDNRKERSTVGLWTMPSDGSAKPKIHRLAYPDGAHDAEAMLLNGDGTPIIVTKEVSRPAALYAPAAALKTDNLEGVPMRKIGEITVPPSTTPSNTLARLGRSTIDGGAVSSGGGKVALRTYTDALEWSVSGGDVPAALKGKPRVTPLPDEPQGEAITYSADGKYFYTVSDMQGNPDDAENYILQYTPVAKVAVTKSAADGAGAGEEDGRSWYDDLTINDITYLVGGVGVIGAILVGFGIFGIMRSRKRPPAAPVGNAGGPHGPKPTDAETELLGVGGAASGPGVYGAGPGVYGAKPAPHKGGVYGAGGGRPPQGGQPGRSGGARPGYDGQPIGRPGGQPARSGGQPARAGGGAGRPGPGGQPVGRPGAGGGRPAPGGQPGGRPGAGGGQPISRPGAGGGQPAARPGSGGQPAARPGSGGQPAGRPAPSPGGRSGGGGGQPMGRPAGGGGGQQGGGRSGGGGVYGAPPAHPQDPAPRSNGSGQRPSGFFGQGAGHQGRPNEYAESRDRDYDYPGYSR